MPAIVFISSPRPRWTPPPPLPNPLQTTNKVILPIRPITSVSTVVVVDATGKEPHRRPSRRDSGSRSLAELPLGLKNIAVSSSGEWLLGEPAC